MPDDTAFSTDSFLLEIARTQTSKPNWYVIDGRKDESTGGELLFRYASVLQLDDYQVTLFKLNYRKCELNLICT